MSGISRVGFRLKSWIRVTNGPLFSHVNRTTFLCSQQCNRTSRLQRFTTEHNLVPQLGKEHNSLVQGSLTTTDRTLRRSNDDVSLADISKPVAFNTHQLVCRLQSRGIGAHNRYVWIMRCHVMLGYTLEQAEELVEILNTVIQQSVASEIGSCVKKVSLVGWVKSFRDVASIVPVTIRIRWSCH